MILHADKESFKELIELASNHFGYEQSHVEKDYWVCKILKEISESEFSDKTYFKGGTSLSKAYGLIQRFSEDLDMFVFSGDVEASKSAEKTLNKKLSRYIIEHNQDIYNEDLSETGGNFRKLYFSYDNVYEGVGLKDNLEVEIKSSDLEDKTQMYYPAVHRNIKSIITAYLEEIENSVLVTQFNLASFDIQCIDPRKTICDKISRLVKLSYNENYIELIAKHIRDIYDLCLMYQSDELKAFIDSDEFIESLYLVTLEDNLNKNSQSHLSLADAVIFKKPDRLMKTPDISSAYNNELSKLVFNSSQMPTVENVISVLESIEDRLLKFEEYRAMNKND